MNRIKIYLSRLRAFFQKILCCQIPLRYFSAVTFPHPIGIVIASGVKLGKGVIIYQNVTIGRRSVKEEDAYPIIMDNVIIYCGASVFGRITIGQNSIITANAVVSKDVPSNSIVYALNHIKK